MIKTILTYDEDTLINFFLFHLKKKDKVRWIYYSLSLSFVILGIIVSFVIKEYVFGFIIIVASLIMFVLYSYQAKKIAKKESKSRYKRDPQEIVFKSERIEQTCPDKLIIYNWDNVLEVDETKKYLYFYVTKNSALIVNKDNLANNEYDSLLDLVKEKKLKHYIYR